jgi:hypothetical protein
MIGYVRVTGGDFLISMFFNFFFRITVKCMFSAFGQAKSMAGISNASASSRLIYYASFFFSTDYFLLCFWGCSRGCRFMFPNYLTKII